ncbi:MAG: thiamine pyrophosphate-binding protein, partial [Alphaproteobacteria bacterium]|nr:thiamine pyrophosphate-binding protein [Alphaproteobacteria bacterium]
GPVVVALPEDMLADRVEIPDAEPYRVARPHPGAGDMTRMREMLAAAQRPIVIAGGAGWSPAASRDLTAWAEANALPVACAFRRQDAFDNTHSLYAGDVGIGINPALQKRIGESDLVIALGPRLGEMTTGGYTLFAIPRPRQALIHVHCDANELGRVYNADLPILSGLAEFCAAARALSPIADPPWRGEGARAHADYLAFATPTTMPGAVDLGKIMTWLGERLPADAIVANGAGNYTTWVHRFHKFRRPGTQLAPTSGAMGYGFPAAIAAKLRHPDRVVLAFAGDGCFLMTGQELASAVQHDIAVITLVINNGMYGTIRMHQEREFPGRVFGTDLVNPDFAAYARAFGALGEKVERTEDFAPAFERALAARKPALIELVIDPEAINTRTTLSAIRRAALAAKGAST